MTTTEKFEPFLVHGVGRRGSLTIHRPAHEGGPTVLGYGHELMITAEAVELMTDRLGRCRLLDYLADEAFQVVKFGEVRVRRGPWEGQSRLLPGSFEYEEAREVARAAAHAITDPRVRSDALASVRAEFGGRTTSRTLATYDGGRDA